MPKYNVYVEDVSLEALINKLGGVEGAKRFLSDELILTEKVVEPAPPPVPEPPLDYVVRVDRQVKPIYPDWMKKLLHPELECTGPTEFDLKIDTELWLHDDQKVSSMKGARIYEHLKASGDLSTCFSLQDLLAIQKKGIKVFREVFGNKAVFGWKSVVQYRVNVLDGDRTFRISSSAATRSCCAGAGSTTAGAPSAPPVVSASSSQALVTVLWTALRHFDLGPSAPSSDGRGLVHFIQFLIW